MGGIALTIRSLPHTQFRRNPYFYLWYDGVYVALCVTVIAAMKLGHVSPLVGAYQASWWLALPVVFYAAFVAHVFIHNAAHGNFPRAINRIVGEILGILTITRFASWQIVHNRHHQFSDDPEKDPHPLDASYWRFVAKSVPSVERQLKRSYFDTFGDNPKSRKIESIRAVVSFLTGILLVVTWGVVVGWQALFFFVLPSVVASVLFISHFNWSTHNAEAKTGEYYPVDLDHGYYKLGNRLFFGIYFHKTHHERASLFNPYLARRGPPPPVEEQRPAARRQPSSAVAA